jgi:hypothetical protein
LFPLFLPLTSLLFFFAFSYLLNGGQRSAIQPKRNGPLTGPFPLFETMPKIRA